MMRWFGGWVIASLMGFAAFVAGSVDERTEIAFGVYIICLGILYSYEGLKELSEKGSGK